MSIVQEFRDFVSSVVSWPADYLSGWYGYGRSEAGTEVNELTAMQVAAFHGCVRLIASALGSTPLNVYERTPDGDKIALTHPLQRVLSLQANPELTAVTLFLTAQSHILTTGNAYLEVAYNGAGQPAALYLRNPYQTRPVRAGADVAPKLGLKVGDLFYRTNDAGFDRIIRAEDMVHVINTSVDGLVGLSPVRLYMREVLGNDLAAQGFSNRFFKNDSRPGGYLSSATPISNDRKKDAVASWISNHSGPNSNTVALLDGGLKWEKVGVNPDEAQFIQTRAMNAKQIGTMMGVPLHFLGESEQSRANMEQRSIEFLIFTMKSWYAKWEQALNVNLFPLVGRTAGRFFCKYDTSDFQRATYADLLKGVQMGRYAGIYTVNEGRKMLGEQPYSKAQLDSKDPGDKLWQPVNMVVVTEDTVAGVMPASGSDGEGQGGSDQGGGAGAAKPSSGTPQGGKRTAERRSDAEIRRYYSVFKPIFRDALGRLLSRSKPDAKDFQRLLRPVLVTIASAFSIPTDGPTEDIALSDDTVRFVDGYIAALAKRAGKWKLDEADSIASEEIKRALIAFREKCAVAPDDEPEGDSEREEDERRITVNVAAPIVNLSPTIQSPPAPVVNLSPEIHSHITMEHKPIKKSGRFVKRADGSQAFEVEESTSRTVKVERQADGTISLSEESSDNQ